MKPDDAPSLSYTPLRRPSPRAVGYNEKTPTGASRQGLPSADQGAINPIHKSNRMMNVIKRTARGKVFHLRPAGIHPVYAQTAAGIGGTSPRLCVVLDADGEIVRQITAESAAHAADRFLREEYGEQADYRILSQGLSRVGLLVNGEAFRILESSECVRDQVRRAFASDRAPIHPLFRHEAAA